MTPRRDAEFFKLKNPMDKVCFLNGMPKSYITAQDKDPEFVNFKCHSRVITSALQKKAYEGIRENWGSAHTACFLSSPHDRDAMSASCQLVRQLARARGFKSFEFVSPFEDMPFLKNKDLPPKELYVLTGMNEKDIEMTHRIRRWMKTPHGASVWVVGASTNPYLWVSEELRSIPSYIFWIKRSGVSVG